MKIRQNDWSEFGKGFIVKMRKNTGFLQAFQHFIIRRNTQEFSKTDICNIANINNIQNQESPKMNTTRRRLGTNRILLTASMLGDFCPMVSQILTKAQF